MNKMISLRNSGILIFFNAFLSLTSIREIGAFSTLDLAFVSSKWGFIDREGNVVIEPVYTRVEAFSDGLAAVKTGGTHFLDGKWGYVDRDGIEVIKSQFDGAKPFHEGRAAACQNGKWGVIDRTGEFRLKPTYDLIGEFHEGLAPFQTDSLWGYLDRNGAVAIPPRFEDVWPFSEGLAAVALERNDQGFPSAWGFTDGTGRMVIEPQFDSGGCFAEGLAAIEKENLIGYIDRDGQWAIPPRFYFSWQQSFHDGTAIVRLSDKGENMALIDKTGAVIRELGNRFDCGVRHDPSKNILMGMYADYEQNRGDAVSADFDPARASIHEDLLQIYECPDGVAVAGKTLYGFAAPSGRVAIAPRFEHVELFSEGRAAFAVNINWKAAQETQSTF